MRIVKAGLAAATVLAVTAISLPSLAGGFQLPPLYLHNKFHNDVQFKPKINAVAPSFAQTGSDGAAPSHAGGVRPGICDSSGPTSGYNRPGGFCDIAANPRSLSDKVKGLVMTSPGVKGDPGQDAKYFCYEGGNPFNPNNYDYYSSTVTYHHVTFCGN